MRVLDLESIRIKIAEITKRIVEEYDPEKVILFGSFAWGEPGPDSDVDLLIVKNTTDDFFERGIAVRRIIDGVLPVDILVRTPEEIKRRLMLGDSFYVNIIKNGKQLYGK
ncbi:MAG: hypothetical protein A2599_01375 [Candidatus Staskawiczbacteria bacterium RIFOXYD1_FULL_39_28]|uniref:Polymerase nucleotidyl transferase domain-containing protein n=1 Tax=Candidatus Staskawiczbacteria bacterium RIFOXYC1_FULL_38_18 TaxID=1802229 RepID=A0A1G2JAA0_9BACT|nr:MAG: hypothetical protein A2401_03875 [Candidatus Staskawiczbacteria bacterium RIFOXYC1_FULL_38_18]OGZ92263.1 MAG: hypothetical protein A2599_01375 [Candidatus Staskawiczbacteria bacterium RIFOXYD1_FULL_39_28]